MQPPSPHPARAPKRARSGAGPRGRGWRRQVGLRARSGSLPHREGACGPGTSMLTPRSGAAPHQKGAGGAGGSVQAPRSGAAPRRSGAGGAGASVPSAGAGAGSGASAEGRGQHGRVGREGDGAAVDAHVLLGREGHAADGQLARALALLRARAVLGASVLRSVLASGGRSSGQRACHHTCVSSFAQRSSKLLAASHSGSPHRVPALHGGCKGAQELLERYRERCITCTSLRCASVLPAGEQNCNTGAEALCMAHRRIPRSGPCTSAHCKRIQRTTWGRSAPGLRVCAWAAGAPTAAPPPALRGRPGRCAAAAPA